MKEDVISMTASEIRTKYDVDEAIARAKSAPEVSLEEIGVEPGDVVARGFAAFKEHINRNGRPKVKDPKVSVSIRIPLSAAENLRATGPGWQTRMSNYLLKGISRGDLGLLSSSGKVSDNI